MSGFGFTIIIPIVLLVSFIFLYIRLQYTKNRDLLGRYQFILSGILLVSVTFWQSVKQLSVYQEWFLKEAYFYIDLAQMFILLVSVFLLIVALSFYADYWQIRKEEIEQISQKVSILTNLQKDANEPYHLLELLNISLKEIVSHLPESSGGIFLINRLRKEFVLTASVGLTQKETAQLERYPLRRNIVSQTIDIGEPMLTGEFKFISPEGNITESRFKSSLVIPFVSGTEKIGGIILLSEGSNYFGNTEIKYLYPVANWLAEKIKTARLSREHNKAIKEKNAQKEETTAFVNKILKMTSQLKTSDPLNSICQQLVGFADCSSVHVYNLNNGVLSFLSGSEPLLNLSENYRTALIDALGKNKPLIINQETTSDDGIKRIILSSLIYPFHNEGKSVALLFRKDAAPLNVSDFELKGLDIIAQFSKIVLKLVDSTKLNVNRRKGFEQIIKLLKINEIEKFEKRPDYIIDKLKKFLPTKSICIPFKKLDDGSFKLTETEHELNTQNQELVLYPGEGELGKAVSTLQTVILKGANSISESLDSYNNQNKDSFLRIFGERGLPQFMAICPINKGGQIIGALMISIFESSEEELLELERLISLAVDLYSTGLTIDYLYYKQTAKELEGFKNSNFGQFSNQINHHLSAVIGNAELALDRDDISGEIKNQFRSIITEIEQASRYLKKTVSQFSDKNKDSSLIEVETNDNQSDIRVIIEESLKRNHISDSLHMIGGSPKEVLLDFKSESKINFTNENLRNLFEETLNRFSAFALDDEIISINSYEKDNFLYLDISHHRKNFPPVEEVAAFGKYLNPDEVLKYRPSETYLNYLDENCKYTFDKYSSTPSYLSFKFPLASQPGTISQSKRIKVLAIDDQPIILELLTAMCRSLDYDIQTTQSGSEGVMYAENKKFDIIFTDLAMPGISGLEVSSRIRKFRPYTPIILLTGWEAKLDSEQLSKSGITNVLYKPFRIEQLTDMIKSSVVSNSLS